MANVKELLDKGYLQSRSIIEVLGKPKAHVEDSLKSYIGQLKKNPAYVVISAEFSTAEEVDKEQGMWGVFAEVEMLAPNIEAMVTFCFDYMPSSVEILQPASMTLNQNDISRILNDLQARLHAVGMQTKQLNSQNLMLSTNIKSLLTNFVLLLLLNAERTSEELAKAIGADRDEIESFLESLIKEKKVIKKENRYTLAKNVK